MKRLTPSLLLHVLLLVLAIGTLAPLVWMLSASFMATGEANSIPPRWFPAHPTLEHYRVLFTRLDVTRYLWNSTAVALTTTFCSLLITSMAGYAFAKVRFRGRDRTFKLLLAALVVPSQVGMLPLFLLLQKLGMVNNLWGVVIPGVASIYGIFLIRQYALGVPDDLLDAARIDGAGEFEIFWTIVLPILKPILVTQALFTFLGSWNDFLWPLIVLSDDRRYTLPLALANLVGEHVQDTELMMAGAVITVLPVLLVFLVLQRFYIRGVLMGSLKG